MKLRFYNNVSKQSFILDATDINDSRLYFHFMVKIPEGLPDGEYEFQLMDDDMKETYGQGLAQIGNYDNNAKKYNKPNGGIKQYQGQ